MRVAEMHLGVHNDLVAFQQDKIAVWYYCLSVALDHNDKRLPRNIKITYLLTVPGILLKQNNFLKVDSVVVIKRFRTEYEYVIRHHLCIAAGNQCFSVALNSRNDDAARNTKLFYLSACPAVVFTKVNFYKMNVLFVCGWS